jgi:hypothetical protein
VKEDFVVGRYPAELLLDILSDGMDYAARGFWAQINRYKWYWWYVCGEDGEPEYPQVINRDLVKPDTVLIEMRDDEDGEAEDEDRPWVGITLDKLAAATDWALDNYNHLFSWHTQKDGIRDDIDYDSAGADVIIQKIVLDDVVYG